MKKFTLILSLLLLFACKGKAANKNQVLTQEAIKPNQKTIQIQRDSNGILEPEDTIKLSNSISGYVKKIHVKENQDIKRNEIFIEIENKDLNIQRLQIESRLRSAKVELELKETNYIKALNEVERKIIQISKSEIELDNKHQELELARKNLEKTEILFHEGAISDEQMENTIFTTEQIESSLVILQKEHELKLIGYRDEDLEKFGIPLNGSRIQALQELNTIEEKAQIKLAQEYLASIENELAILQINEEKLKIRAPSNGIIFGLKVCEGELLEAGSSIANILSTENLKATTRLPLEFINSIKLGMDVDLEITGFKDKVKGKVIAFTPDVDPITTSIGVQLVVNNKDNKLRAGMYFLTTISGANTKTILTLPASAIINSGKSKAIFVVEKGHAFLREVDIGNEHDGEIEIFNGISANEIAIRKPSPELKQGVKVDIK